MAGQAMSMEENDSHIITTCPFCQKEQKLYINFTTGMFDCKVCGEKGGFKRFKWAVVGGKADAPAPEMSANVSTVKRYADKLKDHASVYNYLTQERKLSPAVLEEFYIGVNDRGDISIPHVKDNEVTAIKYRYMGEDETQGKYYYSKGSKPTLYNNGVLKRNPKKVILVEGEFDLLAGRTYGIKDIMAVPGATQKGDDWLKLLEPVEEIYICYDTDGPGQKGAYELASRIGLGKCKNIVLPKNDLNDCLKSGITAEEIGKMIDEAIAFPVPGVVKSLEFEKSVISDIFNPDEIRGEKTGFPTLSKLLDGLRTQELSLISGWTTTGKTTWLKVLGYNLAQSGAPTLIISLETPYKKLIRELITIHSGKSHEELLHSPKEEVLQHLEEIDKMCLYWYDMRHEEARMGVKEFMKMIQDIRARYGIKYVVLDDIKKLTSNSRNNYSKNETAEEDAALNDLSYVAKQQDMHIFVVSHLKKPENEQKMLKTPSLADLKGSSGYLHIPDNILFVHRNIDPAADEELKAQVEIVVAKCRESGETGIINLTYDKDRCRYTEN